MTSATILSDELLVDDVGARRPRGTASRSMPAFCDLGLVGVVDRPPGRSRSTRPIRKMPSSPSMTAVGVFGRGGEDGLHERLVVPVVLGLAASRGRRPAAAVVGVGRHGLGDVLPRLPALEVLERGLGLGLGARPSGPRSARSRRDRSAGCDLDHPDVPRSRASSPRRASRASTSARCRADAFADGELGLEPGVDDPLERDLGELLALLVDRSASAASPCRPRSGDRRATAVSIRRVDSSSRKFSIVARGP